MENPLQTIPKTAPVKELPQKYLSFFRYVKQTSKPLYLFSNNKPHVVILDSQVFENLTNKFKEMQEKLELEEIRKLIKETDKDFKSGKLKPITSLADLD